MGKCQGCQADLTQKFSVEVRVLYNARVSKDGTKVRRDGAPHIQAICTGCHTVVGTNDQGCEA